MRNGTYDSRVADKFVVRMPDGMREQVADEAERDGRSMNSVIVKALHHYLASTTERQAGESRPGDTMHIDDRVKMVGAAPAFLTIVFALPSLNDAQPLIQKLPYGQKALGTQASVFGLTTGNLMEERE